MTHTADRRKPEVALCHHFLLALAADSDFLVIDRVGPGDNWEEVELAPADQIRVRL